MSLLATMIPALCRMTLAVGRSASDAALSASQITTNKAHEFN